MPGVALAWDESGERVYETGVSKGVLWVANAAGTGYNDGVAWNGLTAVNENPEGGDPVELWADNIMYATMQSAEKYGGQINAYMYPDEFMACEGSVELATGVHIAQQGRKNFCLSWRTEIGTDLNPQAGYKIHIAYGCSASPSSKDHQTINDSPDAQEFSWDFKGVPVPVENHKPTAVLEIDSRTVPQAKLTLIEAALYGSSSANSRVLMPNDIYGIITGQ